jgi:hypothetical protein
MWIVEQEERVRFFADGEVEQSVIAPEFPDQL